jgi:hypothetical protein
MDATESNPEAFRPASAEDVVQFYRGLGFFRDGDRKRCTERLLKRFEHDHGRPFDPSRPWDDVYLLSYDEERVWADDPECDVALGNQVYQEVLAEWARVSGGAFAPEEIEEVWDGERGPISVHLRLDGRRYTFRPSWDNDWLDLGILGTINGLIAGTGKQFLCASDVNFAIVFVLDTEGRRILAEQRRFPFLDLSRQGYA